MHIPSLASNMNPATVVVQKQPMYKLTTTSISIVGGGSSHIQLVIANTPCSARFEFPKLQVSLYKNKVGLY